MTPQQKEDYSKAIAGEYTGTYIIVYSDGRDDVKAVKVENSQMTITDQTMHSICFHNYPVSQLSNVVTDPALAEALASAPNVDFQADYHSTTCRTMAMPTGALSLRPFRSRFITAGLITTWW